MNLHVIIGPPTAGKTTYAAQHRKPGDIAIDLDHIANTLAGLDQDNHDHQAHILTVAKAARQAAIDAALKQKNGDVWLIHTRPSPSQMQHYANIGARIHIIDPGKDVVMHRCKTMRTKGAMIAAATWYDNPPTIVTPHKKPPKAKATAAQRGYGWRHQRIRKRLLNQLAPGEPCWWCNRPLYKTPDQNWDHKPLAADHTQTNGAANGEDATRLLHFTCNSQRQSGARDATRPAVLARNLADKNTGDTFTWQ